MKLTSNALISSVSSRKIPRVTHKAVGREGVERKPPNRGCTYPPFLLRVRPLFLRGEAERKTSELFRSHLSPWNRSYRRIDEEKEHISMSMIIGPNHDVCGLNLKERRPK